MVKVVIDNALIKKLERKFARSELSSIKKLLLSLEDNPYQGDILATIGHVVLKEKKYKSFRFYFIHSKRLLIVKDVEKLKNEIIRFIEMSKKNNQRRTIDKLKDILRNLSP